MTEFKALSSYGPKKYYGITYMRWDDSKPVCRQLTYDQARDWEWDDYHIVVAADDAEDALTGAVAYFSGAASAIVVPAILVGLPDFAPVRAVVW